MSAIDSVKKHPVLAGSVAVGALLLFVLAKSGSSSVAAAPAPGDTTSGNDLASQTLQVQSQLQQYSIAASAAAEHDAASLEALKITTAAQQGANELSANIASQQITAQAQTQQLNSTLLATIENNKTKASTDQAAIQANTTIETTRAVTSALVAQSAQSAAVAQASIAASSRGLFSRIFS